MLDIVLADGHVSGAERRRLIAAGAELAFDARANERLELGIGAGWKPEDYDAADVAFDRPSVRIERLGEAIDAFEGSAFIRDAFGDTVVAHLLHFARTEQQAHRSAVTDFERARYLERI